MGDYHNFVKYCAYRSPYTPKFSFQKPYEYPEERILPPMVAVIFYALGKAGGPDAAKSPDMDKYSLLTGFMFVLYSSFLLFLALQKGMQNDKDKFWVTMVFLLSGIFIFSAERANIVILSAACTTFFLFNYKSGSKVVRELSFLSLAFAASVKIAPALLGVLLLQEKRYKEALRLTIYGAVLFFTPFLFLKGGFANIPYWLENLKLNSAAYNFREYPRFNFRYVLACIDFSPATRASLYYLLMPLSAGLGILALISNAYQKEEWKKILQLCSIFALLLINSGQYTGLYLFAGIALFFNQKELRREDLIYPILFLLILNPLKAVSYNFDLSLLAMNIAASLMFLSLTIESSRNMFIDISSRFKAKSSSRGI